MQTTTSRGDVHKLSHIDIDTADGLRSVELYHGDLAQLSGDSAVDILFPIYLRRDRQAPSLYLTFNHVDCCEADKTKLQAAAERLIQQIGA